MCNERYKWLGWVGVLRYYSLAQTLTKPENPRTKKKKINRQQNNRCNNCCDTHEDPREKKKKGTGTGSDVSVPRVVKLLLLLGRPPTTTVYGR